MKKLTLLFVVISLLFSACGADVDVPSLAEVDMLAPDMDARITAPRITEPESCADDGAEQALSQQTPDTEPKRLNIADARDVVFLTFDDGPCAYTERVLGILDDYGIKATFFLVGEQIEKHPEYAKAIANAGHDIGYHSTHHDYAAIYKSPDALCDDITRWENIVLDAIGYVPEAHLFRFPGGSTCSAIKKSEFEALYAAVSDMGYRAFDWTFGNNDRWDGDRKAGQSKVDYLKQSLIVSHKLGGVPRVLLLHETAIETVDTLAWTIDYLLEQGYTFGLLNEYDGEYLFRH